MAVAAQPLVALEQIGAAPAEAPRAPGPPTAPATSGCWTRDPGGGGPGGGHDPGGPRADVPYAGPAMPTPTPPRGHRLRQAAHLDPLIPDRACFPRALLEGADVVPRCVPAWRPRRPGLGADDPRRRRPGWWSCSSAPTARPGPRPAGEGLTAPADHQWHLRRLAGAAGRDEPTPPPRRSSTTPPATWRRSPRFRRRPPPRRGRQLAGEALPRPHRPLAARPPPGAGGRRRRRGGPVRPARADRQPVRCASLIRPPAPSAASPSPTGAAPPPQQRRPVWR